MSHLPLLLLHSAMIGTFILTFSAQGEVSSFLRGNNTYFQTSRAARQALMSVVVKSALVEEEGNQFIQRRCGNTARRSSRTREHIGEKLFLEQKSWKVKVIPSSRTNIFCSFCIYVQCLTRGRLTRKYTWHSRGIHSTHPSPVTQSNILLRSALVHCNSVLTFQSNR